MIKITSDYTDFTMIKQNRDVDRLHPNVKNLEMSMLEYGWLDAFPLMAKKVGKKLLVVDGQHRLAIAQEYGIPVKYVVENRDIDIAGLQKTAHHWTDLDYAKSFAKKGLEDYQELIAFHDEYGISIQMCSAILSNTSSASNCAKAFKNGDWKIKNRVTAYSLGNCYKNLHAITPVFHKSAAVKALWGCMHVDYFDPVRLVDGVEKRCSAIKPVGPWRLNLELMDYCYNFARKTTYPLKFDAEQALKNRNAVGQG
jgi:hypothetical protein